MVVFSNMNELLQQAIESGTLKETTAQLLAQLEPGKYCRHKSWGFGKVSEWRIDAGQVLIDFDSKTGHAMQIEYAVESLTAFPDSHILARVRNDHASILALAEENPCELVRSILSDHGGRATAAQIESVLVPAVFEAPKFKRWWESAKKKLKADGHFHLPSKKTEPLELLAQPTSAHQSLLTKFRGARHLKDQVGTLDQLVKSLDDFAHEVEELRALSLQIEDAAGKGRRLQSAQALELLLGRDEILRRHESLKAGDTAPSVADILASESPRLADLFSKLPAAKQRAALDYFEEAFGADWPGKAAQLLQTGGPRLAGDICKLFASKNRSPDLKEQLYKWIVERSATSDLLYWLCKERGSEFPELFNAALFGAVLSALELDQLSETKKSMRLRDLIVSDHGLLGEFFANSEADVIRDAMRRLLLTTVFDELDRRSLIGRMIKMHPELQSMVSGEPETVQESLTVSWASLEKRKAEFDDLVNRQIPQNIRDIQIARDYGDLRENFEFKSAKEQQVVLNRRKSELEQMLGNARGTNFENPDTSVVSIGTTVRLKDVESGAVEEFSILGAWDSAPEKGIIAYKAAIGQALLGKKAGEEVNLSGGKRVLIESITAFTNLDLLVQISQSASQPA